MELMEYIAVETGTKVITYRIKSVCTYELVETFFGQNISM